MAENQTEEKWAPISWEMGDVFEYIVRNYEDIQKEYASHTFEPIPYSISLSFLKAIMDKQRDNEIPKSVFFHALFKKASCKYSEIGLFAKISHPQFPHIQTIPMVVTSNKTDMPLNTMEEIQTYALTDEKMVITLENGGVDEALTDEEISSHSSLFLHMQPEYVQHLLEHDEEQIQEAMRKYEKQLRNELKETGRLSCNKPKLKLS